MEARSACGNMVLFVSFSEKAWCFRPAGGDIPLRCSHFMVGTRFCASAESGDIPRQTRERLIHGSIGRFALFAHFAAFAVQTPTA